MAEKKASLHQKELKTRKRIKKNKPDFVRSESWRYVKLKESWRKPRGLDHKMRRKIKGWPPTVSVGYKGPKDARGLHPSGYREVLVHNIEEISKVDPRSEAARIAHTVGKKKRVQIIAEAKKREVFILNFTSVEELVETEEAKPEEAEEETEKLEKLTKKENKSQEKDEKPKHSSIRRKKESQTEQKSPVKK
ncbi:50S ribosomal protein L32e, partial [Candidatus Bathyarchaeota archaeon]